MPFLIQLDSFEAILFEYIHFQSPEIFSKQAIHHFDCHYQFDKYLTQHHSKGPLECNNKHHNLDPNDQNMMKLQLSGIPMN